MSVFATHLNPWAELWYYGIVPLVALVPILDRLLGVSPRLARLLHIKQPDFILLVLTVMLGAALIIALQPIFDNACFGICDVFPVGNRSLGLIEHNKLLDRQLEAISQYKQLRFQILPIVSYLDRIDLFLVLLCPFICLWLAVRQKRPVMMWLVWFVMGICGTFGSVFWLIAEQRKTVRLAHT